MPRFLFTVWPLAGHYFPNIALARDLRDRGHEVCFYTGSRAARTITAEGYECFPFESVNEEDIWDIVLSSSDSRFRWQELANLRRRYKRWLIDTLPGQMKDLESILHRRRPDVVVCDPMMWAPYLALPDTHGLPVAIFAYVPFCLIPSPDVPPPGLGLRPPKTFASAVYVSFMRACQRILTADIRRDANRFRESLGLSALSQTVSEYAGTMPLYLVAGTPGFDYGRADIPANVHYVGPILRTTQTTSPPPEWLMKLPAGQPLVHVSEGTVHTRAPIVLRAAVRGLAGSQCYVSIATGTQRDPADLGLTPLPPNVRVDQWVTYSQILPRTQVVVTTAGAGTVLETLTHGVPLVVIPTDWDKPEVARRVAEAGAGILISPQRCNPSRLRAAVERVLSDSSYAENARRLAADFRQAGGPGAAAIELERLAQRTSSDGARPTGRLQ